MHFLTLIHNLSGFFAVKENQHRNLNNSSPQSKTVTRHVNFGQMMQTLLAVIMAVRSGVQGENDLVGSGSSVVSSCYLSLSFRHRARPLGVTRVWVM